MCLRRGTVGTLVRCAQVHASAEPSPPRTLRLSPLAALCRSRATLRPVWRPSRRRRGRRTMATKSSPSTRRSSSQVCRGSWRRRQGRCRSCCCRCCRLCCSCSSQLVRCTVGKLPALLHTLPRSHSALMHRAHPPLARLQTSESSAPTPPTTSRSGSSWRGWTATSSASALGRWERVLRRAAPRCAAVPVIGPRCPATNQLLHGPQPAWPPPPAGAGPAAPGRQRDQADGALQVLLPGEGPWQAPLPARHRCATL